MALFSTLLIMFALLQGPVSILPHMSGMPVSDRSTRWGLIGNDGNHLTEEAAIGIGVKVVRLSWRDYMLSEESANQPYISDKREEFDQLRRSGFRIIVDAGLQDTPEWVHDTYRNSRYVNQFGEEYRSDGELDSGDANLVFNHELQTAAGSYLRHIFADLGTDWFAVRVGGGRYGELTYPPAVYGESRNNYWAFDANALAQSPVPHWIPGQRSMAGEAASFVAWYLDVLSGYQTWQLETIRRDYSGPIMVLYPSWGIRPGQVEQAVAGDLAGTTSAEINGEIQRGLDFARQLGVITDPDVIVTTTWLDADASGDEARDQRYWSPVKYLSNLAQAHPLNLAVYGENTGWNDADALRFTATQMWRYGLIGMAWFREDQLFAGPYATLGDYAAIIELSVPERDSASLYTAMTPRLRPSTTNSRFPCSSSQSGTARASGPL